MMEPLRSVSGDELSSLVMENELLRYEVQHLRARLAAAQAAEAEAAEAEEGRDAGPARPTGDQAELDIVWLLHRVDRVPVAGRLLRRRPGIRLLRERHLGKGEA